MSLIGSLVQMIGGGAHGGGGNLALINAIVRMLGNDAPGGGIGGLGSRFNQGGMGDVFNSWVGRGQNMPISPEQVDATMGPDWVAQIARQLGINNGEAAAQVSRALPQVVDTLTPDGHVPEQGLGTADELFERLGPR